MSETICPQCNRPVARRVIKGLCDLCHNENWRRANPEKVKARQAKYAARIRENKALKKAAGLPTRAWGKIEVVCITCAQSQPHYAHGQCRPCYRKEHISDLRVCTRCQRVNEHQAKGLCKPCYLSLYERANPEKIALHRKRHHVKRYFDLTLEAYESLLSASPACAICAQTFGEALKPCVDHCHTGGHVRGVLCAACNKTLGLMKDSPERLRKAAEYLEKT